MRIAFLCKRRYMGKDVIADRYARLYEIPFQLALLGHDVRGFCLSYGAHDEGEWEHQAKPGRLHWESRSIGGWRSLSFLSYPWRLLQRLREYRPDVLIGASDIPHVALGAWLAKKLRIPYAADLYDNFEGFGQARIPGMVPALRHAVRSADLVTTTSSPLRDFVVDVYKARGEVLAMPSTVDKAVFHPRDKIECQRALDLPIDAKLIGTAGGLHRDKGVDVLYAAWRSIASKRPDAHLVLAGPIDKRFPPPCDVRIHYLGQLPHARTAELFCALDVGVIYMRNTVFGRYCFPQKACEMLACELPVVAARVGVMTSLLSSVPECLYEPEDADDLARAVLGQLDQRTPLIMPIEDWAHIVRNMERELRVVAGLT